ncbi:MAG: hypothetical protein ACJA2S_005017 [Cyclobacteriaceae bacterium]|jgi:hypothetical protein
MSESSGGSEMVERIIGSDSFGKSLTYANLLRYLVDCTKSEEVPKESTVGTQIFGLNASENYDSAKVRVYIYNLRKKLTLYFQNEGVNEEYILTIPKGSYKVEYTKKTSIQGNLNISKYKNISLILFCILTLSIVVNAILWNQKKLIQKSYEVLPKTEFWNDFIDDDRPILVVVGDLFIFTEHNEKTGTSKTVREFNINSELQYKEYKENHTDSTIELGELTYTYLIKNSMAWIESLTTIFFSHHKYFSTRVISRIDAKDLHDHNVIFIGMQKTAGLFNNYFLNSKFALKDDNTYSYQANDNTETQLYSPSGDPDAYHTDYGFVAKYPGPNNNTIFMFGGIGDIAASQSLKNFTDRSSLISLEAQMRTSFGKIPDHFEILFEVSGVDRTEFDTKVLHMNEIKESDNIWVEK